MDIASRIKKIREISDLNQEDFAQAVGVHKNSLGRYERGDSKPDSDFFVGICTKFGVNLNWLITGTGPMRADESMPAPANTEYERRIAELEKALAEAKDEALKAYKLAVEAMRAPTNAIQEPEEPTTPKGERVVIHNSLLSDFGQKRK